MFKISLEPSLLVSLLETFLATLQQSNDDAHTASEIRDYVDALAKVPRFKTVLLFLSKNEKVILREVWEHLGLHHADPVWGIN